MCSHSQVHTRHKCLHTDSCAHKHTLRHECPQICAHTSFEPHFPELSLVGSCCPHGPRCPAPPAYSQQGSVNTILDTHHKPWRSHFVAQVVARVGCQAEIAVHQGHQGQGPGPGRQGQLLQARGMSARRRRLEAPPAQPPGPGPTRHLLS